MARYAYGQPLPKDSFSEKSGDDAVEDVAEEKGVTEGYMGHSTHNKPISKRKSAAGRSKANIARLRAMRKKFKLGEFRRSAKRAPVRRKRARSGFKKRVSAAFYG
jgi:hypothetical protein